MKFFLDIVTEVIQAAFKECGYDEKYGKVIESNRPDLCEYQCNGALACAKEYKKNPMDITNDIVNSVQCDFIEKIEACKPGFININVNSSILSNYLNEMQKEEKFGVKITEKKKIVLDYGGPNAAKPLHVGHLRPAIIGEAIKRLERYVGHEVIGDVHLGDWGMPMGLIIAELKEQQPNLPFFDEKYDGEYPSNPPFTISELEKIYPLASSKSKTDDIFKASALKCTKDLQEGRKGYRALWKHILDVSVSDLKNNFKKLDVNFDLWYGESDADKYIPNMVKDMKEKGHAFLSDGALVVNVSKPDDKKEIPPCIILKSDGASLYETTDLAAIVQRQKDFEPDCIAYVVDNRQELHFEQVFRCARKTQIVSEKTELKFIGFGTMNGTNGKPYKTRDGGVMRLMDLVEQVNEVMLNKIIESRKISLEEAQKISEIIGLAAIKYGDLSNQASRDYIFDIDRFTSFEGKTGPYILYTIVRINSIIKKYVDAGGNLDNLSFVSARLKSEKDLMLQLSKFNVSILNAALDYAPHKVCSFIYDLADSFNAFYHEKNILDEKDINYQKGLIAMANLTKRMLIDCINILGFSYPEKM